MFTSILDETCSCIGPQEIGRDRDDLLLPDEPCHKSFVKQEFPPEIRMGMIVDRTGVTWRSEHLTWEAQ